MRPLAGGMARVEIEGATVGEVIDGLEARFPGVRERLVDDGRLRAGLAVFVDGVNSQRRLRTKLRPDNELHFIESLGGGSPTLAPTSVDTNPPPHGRGKA